MRTRRWEPPARTHTHTLDLELALALVLALALALTLGPRALTLTQARGGVALPAAVNSRPTRDAFTMRQRAEREAQQVK